MDSLEPFFSRLSVYSFESVYHGTTVDWELVESSIEQDIFEGDQ